jgi:oxalate decarboxylase/phosphoglucose isomerase-like protein (cupin superfamily)
VLKMRAGCVAYIPMHWWHQVLLLSENARVAHEKTPPGP